MERRHLIAAALILGGFIIAATALTAGLLDIPVGMLTRDAVTTADVPPYTGVVGAFNAMVWFAAAVLSAFVAWVTPQQRRRLGLFALLLFVLAADDALLLHDSVGPHVGIDETVFYMVYVVIALAVSRSVLGAERTVVVAFCSGAALLAASATVDLGFVGRYLLEDGAKLLGALVWLTVPLLAYSAGPPDSVGRTQKQALAHSNG